MIDWKSAIANIQDLVTHGSFQNRDNNLAQIEEQKKKDQQIQSEQENALKETQKMQQEADKQAKVDELHQFKVQKEQLNLVEKLVKLLGGGQQKLISPEGSETLPKADPLQLIADALKKGFEDYSSKSGYANPLATMSAEMAKAGQNNPLPDPYLPATINLMETSGSKNMAQPNNYFNWGKNPKPDINTAINRIYEGVANPNGLYKDYLQSGDLADFFRVYTPSIDPNNPAQEELIKRYTKLRKYFPD